MQRSEEGHREVYRLPSSARTLGECAGSANVSHKELVASFDRDFKRFKDVKLYDFEDKS
jgi:hypothetical protein